MFCNHRANIHNIFRMKINIIKRLSSSILFFVLLCYSCENNVSEPISDCSDLEVYYNNSVEPIMVQYCTICHSGGAPSGSLNLDSYSSFRANISEVIYVVNLEANSSSIMPPYGEKLSDSVLSKLQAFYDMEKLGCE